MKGDIFRGKVQLWHHHGLTIDGRGFPPQNTARELCHLFSGQRHAELQPEVLLLAGGAVHQILHLLEVRAEAVDIT